MYKVGNNMIGREGLNKVGNNMIGREGLKMEEEAITKLVKLNLGIIDVIVEDNNILYLGAKQLANILKNNTTLTYLNLSIHLLLT